MGTENKEVIPKEEISEESEPHGAILEKLPKVVYQGHEFGAACEEDILEEHSRESTEEILEQVSPEERDFASGLIIFKKSPSSEKDHENNESSVFIGGPNFAGTDSDEPLSHRTRSAATASGTKRQNSHLGVHQKTCTGEALGIPMWKTSDQNSHQFQRQSIHSAQRSGDLFSVGHFHSGLKLRSDLSSSLPMSLDWKCPLRQLILSCSLRTGLPCCRRAYRIQPRVATQKLTNE
eukprot:bmy_08635T0